ncbi:MAG: HAD-IA family hydrolase [Betaproteobacteria bacterium]|nr:HAD-IA family hydrolase [Betaproteobacteria bacterium]
MPKRFNLLVFDWDGTLMDSAAAITHSLRAACADLALPVPSEERARYIIGLGLHDALKYVLPDFPVTGYPALLERYRLHFLKQDRDTALFAGAEPMLQTLRDAGFLLAVATGKSRRGLDRALEATGLTQVFHATRCADESFSKPHPGMLLWLLDEFSIERERTLMIGDTSHDMEMAIAADVPRLGVAYGAHPRENLVKHDPVACLNTFDELTQWLTTHA